MKFAVCENWFETIVNTGNKIFKIILKSIIYCAIHMDHCSPILMNGYIYHVYSTVVCILWFLIEKFCIF